MPERVTRKGIGIGAAIVILVMLIMTGLPFIASTQIVRDRIAYQMSAWTGYRVRLDDAPELQLWPTFRAVLHDVTLLDWNRTDPKAVLTAERVEMDLSALAALRGEVVFTTMRLVQPVLRLTERDGELRLPPPQGWGRLNRSVETARLVVSDAAVPSDMSTLPDDTFGTIEFEQGRLVAEDDGQQINLVTSLSGTLDWPALNRRFSLSANGIWRGESVSLNVSSTQPLILLAGGRAPLNLSLEAAPARITFTGSANIANEGFIDGQLALESFSLSRLIEWTHDVSLSANRVGAFQLTSRILGDTRRVKFENAALKIDSSAGAGLIDLSFGDEGPLLAGTLAFDSLNLGALFGAIDPFSAHTVIETIPTPFAGGSYELDFRFSAKNATFGSATLTNVAAAGRVNRGFAALAVSDATAFGGTIQFATRADHRSGQETIELRLAGEKIDMSQLTAALGYEGLIPKAPGTFSIVLKGTGHDLDAFLQNGSGTVSASLGPGSISGLGLDAFFEHSAHGDFFPVSALEASSLPIDGVELKASITNGIARLETAEARSGPYRIVFDGLVPLAGRALAMNGRLTAPDGNDPRAEPPLSFFVGGSWSAPFIAPALDYRRPQR